LLGQQVFERSGLGAPAGLRDNSFANLRGRLVSSWNWCCSEAPITANTRAIASSLTRAWAKSDIEFTTMASSWR
jgi:hypothetical protein